MTMKKRPRSLLWFLSGMAVFLQGCLTPEIIYDRDIPQVAFAAQELKDALREAGKEDLEVALVIKADESKPEAFQIRLVEPDRVEITGTDATGAMYGGIEVAQLVRLGLPVEDQEQEPFVVSVYPGGYRFRRSHKLHIGA